MVKIVTTQQTSEDVRREWNKGPKRILLNKFHRLLSPQYFADAAIGHLPIFLNRAGSYNVEGRKKVWQEQGGILLDHSPRSGGSGARDVLVLVECPLSELALQQHQAGTESLVIVNKPVTWVSHIEAIKHLYPVTTQVPEVMARMPIVPGREHICDMIKTRKMHYALTSAELRDVFPELEKPLRGIQNFSVVEVQLRIKPMADKHLFYWNQITALPGEGKVRYLVGNNFEASVAIGKMNAQGCVIVTRFKVFSEIDDPRLNFLAAEKAHYTAVINLKNMIRYVEDLPKYE